MVRRQLGRHFADMRPSSHHERRLLAPRLWEPRGFEQAAQIPRRVPQQRGAQVSTSWSYLAVSTFLFSAGCATTPAIAGYPEACPVCSHPEPEPKPLSSDGLLAARWTELTPSVATRATFTRGEPHIRSGVGFEFAP